MALRHSMAQSRFFSVGINTHKHTAVLVHVTKEENFKTFRPGLCLSPYSYLLH